MLERFTDDKTQFVAFSMRKGGTFLFFHQHTMQQGEF